MATILHIDHDDIAQRFVKATLGHEYNVVSATDGPTAIQYCAMIQPDLILMDLDLPDTDGYELNSRLKQFMPQTPVLILAADGPGALPAETRATSSDGILVKPIAEDELWRSIHLHLPQPGPSPKRDSTFGVLSDDAIDQLEAQIDALNQANKRLASLNAISALIGTSLDLEHLTDEILGQIQKTIDFDSATLFLLKGNILEAAASRGLSEYRRGMNSFSKSDRNSAWRVVNNKLPLIINDVTKSKYWEPRPELSLVRSWLGVPLIYKDHVVGVLTLDKNEPEAFIEADARYFFTLAYQIAIAVENAQLFQDLEDQATRLKLINEVSHEIATILDFNLLFEALAWAIFERLSYDRVAIFDVEQTHSSIVLQAYFDRFIPQLDGDDRPHSVDETLVEQVVKTGRPAVVTYNPPPNGSDPLEERDVHSELATPVLVDNNVVAVISIGSDNVNGLGDQDLWTLSSLASHAATVVENARLYHNIDSYSEKLERTVAARTQRLQAVNRISHVVSQGLDVNELLAVVGHEISQIFAPEGSTEAEIKVVIGLVFGSHLNLRIINDFFRSNRSDPGNDAVRPDMIVDADYKLNPQTSVGQVIGQSKPLILRNVDILNMYDRTSTSDKLDLRNSLLMAPLITAGKTIGLIMVESQLDDAFDESDLESLESVAFQVATGIEHARLLQKTRELAIVDERTRLARDMHDGVAQNLAYLLIQVDRSLNLVEEDSKLETQLELIGTVLKQNIEELRRNIFDLRPVDLEGKSLFDVLENFVTEFGRRWSLKTDCRVQGEAKDMPPEVERCLYRILQESLSNARQHAQCTQLWVEVLVKDNQTVSLEVRDDGRGFEMDQPSGHVRRRKGKGLGLVSMRERAEDVAGQLHVESARGQGTRIYAELPLDNRVGDDDASRST